MKWSQYNIIYTIDEHKSIIYNYAKDHAIVVLKELLSLIEEKMHCLDSLNEIHPDLYSDLINKKIIIDDLVDERHEIMQNIKEDLGSQTRLQLTINPTLDCNLECWYCYESHIKDSYINETVNSAIVKFVDNQVKKTALEVVDLSFFGGEPLLKAAKIAIPLAIEIKKMSCDNNKIFSLSFTTNAVLLSKSIVDSIVEISPNVSFQIPFDGGRELHNQTKKLKNSLGTYDIILNNIDYALSKDCQINVRCNYSLDNIDSFADLIDDLAKLPHYNAEKIAISLQRIWQVPVTEELHNKASYIQQVAKDRGFTCDVAGSTCAKSYCYADYANSYVINYNGDVFKCTAREFEPKRSIGKLDENGVILYSKNFDDLINLRFNSDCKDCKVLPICTTCSQTHMESNTNKCPYNIPEEDKIKQIEMRMKDLFCID